MKRFRKTALFVFLALPASCVGTEYTEAGARVQAIQVGQTNNCTYLGPVSAFGAVIEGGLETALIRARNDVAAYGGNRIALISATTDSGSYAHGRVQAEAYKC